MVFDLNTIKVDIKISGLFAIEEMVLLTT